MEVIDDVKEILESFTKDEGKPFVVDFQEQTSNYFKQL
jgi:hypothetical protein